MIHTNYTTEYEYVRNKLADGLYDIDHPEVDRLIKDILANGAFTGVDLRVSYRKTICYVCFKSALSAEDKTTLDGIVSANRYEIP